MTTLELSRRINAPAGRVWAFLSTDEVVHMIVGVYADKAEMVGEGEDAVLVTTLSEGEGILRERIELLDHKSYRLVYRMLDVGPYPYANYVGEMCVTASGPDTSIISLQCEFVPVGPEAEAKKFWLEHNTEVTAKLDAYLAGT